jgi:uncharacterized DUF497 family protein
MEIRFHRDPETGQPHIWEHGVTKAEALQVLQRPGETITGRGEARIALGQTAAGRYLKVVFVPRRDGEGLMVITAYDLRGKELKAYRRRRRRRSS